MFKFLKPKKKYEVINSVGTIFQVHITDKYMKHDELHYKGVAMICGLYWFKCEFSISELAVLEKFLPLKMYFTEREPNTDTLNSMCVEIDFQNKLPLFNIIYLFCTKNGKNLDKFHNEIITHKEYEELPTQGEKIFFLYDQVYKNREGLEPKWNLTNQNLSLNWIFSNGNLTSKYSRVAYIENLMPTLCPIFPSAQKYENTTSFNELMNIISGNKHFSFDKELRNFIQDNLLTNHESSKSKYALLNVNMFEQVRLILEIDRGELKSLKDLIYYLEHLKKMALSSHREIYMNENCTVIQDIKEFCSLFKESPLDVLKKANIPYHLLPKKIEMIKEYYQDNEILSVRKEKKLYYFLTHLSKRLFEKKEKVLMKNPNTGFNQSVISYKNDSFLIKTVTDSHELLRIGTELNICAGNNETFDDYQKTYVYLVETTEGKKYLGCIKNGIFDHFKGYKNSAPSFNLFQEVFKYLQSEGFLSTEYSYEKSCTKFKKQTLLENIYESECIHRIYFE